MLFASGTLHVWTENSACSHPLLSNGPCVCWWEPFSVLLVPIPHQQHTRILFCFILLVQVMPYQGFPNALWPVFKCLWSLPMAELIPGFFFFQNITRENSKFQEALNLKQFRWCWASPCPTHAHICPCFLLGLLGHRSSPSWHCRNCCPWRPAQHGTAVPTRVSRAISQLHLLLSAEFLCRCLTTTSQHHWPVLPAWYRQC